MTVDDGHRRSCHRRMFPFARGRFNPPTPAGSVSARARRVFSKQVGCPFGDRIASVRRGPSVANGLTDVRICVTLLLHQRVVGLEFVKETIRRECRRAAHR